MIMEMKGLVQLLQNTKHKSILYSEHGKHGGMKSFNKKYFHFHRFITQNQIEFKKEREEIM